MKGAQVIPSSSSGRTCTVHTSIGRSVLTMLALTMCLSVAPAISKQVEIQATPAPTKAEQAACSRTPYTEECLSSLTAHRTSTNSNTYQESSFLIASLKSSQAAFQDFKSLCNSNFGEISDTQTCMHSALSACLQSLEMALVYFNSSISHLELLTESNSTPKMEDILTWLSASLTYHTTCIEERNHCSNLEDLNISLAHGYESMVRATNCVSLASAMLQKYSSREIPNRRLLAAPALDKGTMYDMDGDYPQWMHTGIRHLLQSSVNITRFDTIVAKDGSGNHSTVQAAVDGAPFKNNTSYIIRIKQGVYNELVNVPSSTHNVMFIGDGINKTIITGSLSVIGDNLTTFRTATVGFVADVFFGSLDIANIMKYMTMCNTATGPCVARHVTKWYNITHLECCRANRLMYDYFRHVMPAIDGDGFLAKDVTFRNTAGAANHQAVATRIDSDKSAFYRCSFEGYQDTLYAHSFRQFYQECTMYGTIDFIFGNSASLFQNCNLVIQRPLMAQHNSVTAQGRASPSQNTGFSFQNCSVTATPELASVVTGPYNQSIQSFLGRPWKAYSRTIFMETYMTGVIDSEGWVQWNGTDFAIGTLYYGEYKNFGPGGAFTDRVRWATNITDPEVAAQYGIPFISGAQWLPQTGIPFASTI